MNLISDSRHVVKPATVRDVYPCLKTDEGKVMKTVYDKNDDAVYTGKFVVDHNAPRRSWERSPSYWVYTPVPKDHPRYSELLESGRKRIAAEAIAEKRRLKTLNEDKVKCDAFLVELAALMARHNASISAVVEGDTHGVDIGMSVSVGTFEKSYSDSYITHDTL